MFQRFVKRIGGRCAVADGNTFEFGATRVVVSRPVLHGEDDSGMGYVLMLCVKSGMETFLYSSDVQGPMSKETAHLILEMNPSTMVLGGPPTYLQGIRVQESAILRGLDNAAAIAQRIPITILEHHLLRSKNWRAEAERVFDLAGEAGRMVVTGAEYLGLSPVLLESEREELYRNEPPSQEFVKWTELRRDKRSALPPPI